VWGNLARLDPVGASTTRSTWREPGGTTLELKNGKWSVDEDGDVVDAIEAGVHRGMTTMHNRLVELGIDHVWDDYGPACTTGRTGRARSRKPCGPDALDFDRLSCARMPRSKWGKNGKAE